MSAHSRDLIDVAIVGGGIAGLSTAYYLQKQAPELRYLLLEGADRWGGKIQTETVDLAGIKGGVPFVVEGGPDSFITQKPWGLQLARELGLDDQLLPTNDAQRRVFVLNKGKPTELPDGVLLIVPTKFMPFALSPLISPAGKLRMGMDLVIPAKDDDEDETLADFIQRRLGSEALDKIAEPLMSGIYNAEAERQSLMATFPRFRDIERKHGSLIRGMLASRKARQPKPSNGASTTAPPAPSVKTKPTSVFMSLRDGMSELVSALLPQLTGECRLSTRVDSLSPSADGYRLALSDGSELRARTVVLAVPAYIAAELVRECAPVSAAVLDEIRYVSTGTISLAFRRDQVDHPLDGFGLVIPRSEGRMINAITWTSTKFDHRAPADHILLRSFFGGSRRPEMMEHDDALLTSIALQELRTIMGISAEPVLTRIFRWFRSNPQYDVGHLDRVAAIEEGLPSGLYVTGSPYRGVGIPDCVHQAQQMAAQLAVSVSPNAVPR